MNEKNEIIKASNGKAKVYVASPYTVGDVAVNVKFQMDVADELYKHGILPFVPLYSHFQHMAHPRKYEDWMETDFAWIDSCEYLLRVGGTSPGGDREVEYAKHHGIQVFFSIGDLVEHIESMI